MAPFLDFLKLLTKAYLPLLFYLPSYYASRAAPVLHKFRLADGMCPRQVENENSQHIISEPAPAHLKPVVTHSKASSLASSGDALDQDVLPHGQFTEIDLAWNAFITRCKQDWIAIASVSFTFVIAAPAAMQLFDNPLTLFLIYFAVFRAVAAGGFSVIQLAIFHDPDGQSGQFTRYCWLQSKNDPRSRVSTLWIILSLPAVAFCWGAIGLFTAMLSSVWCGRSTHKTAQRSIGFVPQLIITLLCAVDFGLLIWIAVGLKRPKRQADRYINL